MLGRFTKLVNTNGDRNAICISGSYMSYAQLAARAASIQQYLDQEFGSEKRIAIEAVDSFDTYATILALLFSGKAYVPLHPQNPVSRNSSICKLAGVNIVLNSGKMSEDSAGLKNVPFDHIVNSPGAALQLRAADHDLAYILFTSGSTGQPKGVPITHANLTAFCDAFEKLNIRIEGGDRFLQMFDLTFDLSVMSYLLPLLHGACVYPVQGGGIKFMNVYELLEEAEITHALMVPSVISHLRPYFSDIQLPSLRYSMFCGEALPYDTAIAWQSSAGAEVLNMYGPTEATIFCTAASIGQAESYNGICEIGQPLHRMTCGIFDELGSPVPAGNKGELCLSGPQLTPGYLNDDKKNNKSFFTFQDQRYYRTGDIAFKDGEGRIFYCGRLDQQVKVMGGYRVELGEIEHHARSFTHSEAVAVACPQAGGITQITLFITAGNDINELRQHLESKLPAYMMPACITDISEFPLNSNGKTDRRALLQRAGAIQMQLS